MKFIANRKQSERDSVSRFIQGLAIGLLVLGTVFGLLDYQNAFQRLESPHPAEMPST